MSQFEVSMLVTSLNKVNLSILALTKQRVGTSEALDNVPIVKINTKICIYWYCYIN